MELSTTREVISCVNTEELPQHFMEPEGSLPHSQEATTGLYSEPDQSRPTQTTAEKNWLNIHTSM
jgi:hypothetical protein